MTTLIEKVAETASAKKKKVGKPSHKHLFHVGQRASIVDTNFCGYGYAIGCEIIKVNRTRCIVFIDNRHIHYGDTRTWNVPMSMLEVLS